MKNSNWNEILDPGLEWMPRLNELISNSTLPDLKGATLYIASDFSGQHRHSKYEVMSFLISDLRNSMNWALSRKLIRDQLLFDGRRMSFKGLNDKKRRMALKPFLDAANEIDGICINLVFRKNLTIRYFTKETMTLLEDNSPFKGRWSYQSLDNMFKIVHFASIFIAGFSKPGQNILWISDQDQIFANETRSQDVSILLSAFTDIYVKCDLGELMIGTTSIDEDDRMLEDITAVPDLSAGALSECFTSLNKKTGGKIPCGLVYNLPKEVTPKTDSIISWLADNASRLKKLILLFECFEKGMFGISRIQIE